MDAHDSWRLIEAGRRAAQAWLDESGIPDKPSSDDGSEVWLQVLVGNDGTDEVIPSTFRPDDEMVKENGTAAGPGGEPGMALKLWRPLEYLTLASGTRVAVYAEKEVLDDRGKRRDLWMPM